MVRGATEDDGWRRAGWSGVRNSLRTNGRYLLRNFVRYTRNDIGMTVEELECGHTVHTPDSIMGQDQARKRRRCHECPNPGAVCVCSRGKVIHWIDEHNERGLPGMPRNMCKQRGCICRDARPATVKKERGENP